MENDVEVKITESPKNVAKRVGKAIIELVKNSGQQRVDIALSGGSTPKKLFKHLAKKYQDFPDWHKVHFWWGDERCVPPGSKESNFRMAHKAFLSQIAIPAENIHRIKGEANPEQEAARYSDEISKNLNDLDGWPVFDLIILGLGDDGHTASIFPSNMQLFDSEQICEVAIHPDTGQKRVTLTGRVINNANKIFFMVTGMEKASRVSEIMNNEDVAMQYPAYYVIPGHGKLYWYLDQEAAEMI